MVELNRMADEKSMSRSDYIRCALFSPGHTDDMLKRKIASAIAELSNYINSMDRKCADDFCSELDGIEGVAKELCNIL